jgi:peptidoglycan/LPS O-acetylase OafA/YrhL
MASFLFSIVLSAEQVVDIFFWLTAFLGSYFLLCKLKERDGLFPPGGIAMIYLNRLVRLLPLYMFAMFFFWKFLVLFGGDGPLFFQYQTTTECQKYWFWHLTFLNNIVPWSQHDTCLPWTWYLANDFQFFLTLPILTQLYFDKQKR